MSRPFTVPTAIAAPKPGYMSLTIVGSGASTAVPVIGHIGTSCACRDAVANPRGPNRRSNVSLLITTPNVTAPAAAAAAQKEEKNAGEKISHTVFASAAGNTVDGTSVHCTLIDCGKTFREAYFRVLVQHRVRLVDALFLTHDHADAISGLDDLRDLQQMHMVHDRDWKIDSFIPTYLLGATLDTLRERVGYIVRNSQTVGAAPKDKAAHEALLGNHIAALKKEKGEEEWNVIGIRRSTALQFFTLPDDAVTPFYVPALCDGAGDSMPLFSVPVEHGAQYTSLGYVFGRGTAFKSGSAMSDVVGKSCVVYISDVSSIPDASLAFLQSLVKIDVLYLDCIYPAGHAPCPVHYTMDDAVELVIKLKPRYVIMIGMYCALEHEEGQQYLRAKLEELVSTGVLKEGEVLGMELGYDGMEIVLPQ